MLYNQGVTTMLNTKNLTIRTFKPDDFYDLYEYLSLKVIYKYEPGEPITLKEAKRLTKIRSNFNNFLAVVLKSQNKVIGHIYFQQIEPKDVMTWEIGYIFNPIYQNKGYATEASKAIILDGLKNKKIHRIIGRCNPKNIASWKVFEKLGMKKEATLRKNIFFKKDKQNNPIWLDTYEYALLDEDLT
jgi:RimJ/RimL family protein N-acetyltransferase